MAVGVDETIESLKEGEKLAGGCVLLFKVNGLVNSMLK